MSSNIYIDTNGRVNPYEFSKEEKIIAYAMTLIRERLNVNHDTVSLTISVKHLDIVTTPIIQIFDNINNEVLVNNNFNYIHIYANNLLKELNNVVKCKLTYTKDDVLTIVVKRDGIKQKFVNKWKIDTITYRYTKEK